MRGIKLWMRSIMKSSIHTVYIAIEGDDYLVFGIARERYFQGKLISTSTTKVVLGLKSLNSSSPEISKLVLWQLITHVFLKYRRDYLCRVYQTLFQESQTYTS